MQTSESFITILTTIVRGEMFGLEVAFRVCLVPKVFATYLTSISAVVPN